MFFLSGVFYLVIIGRVFGRVLYEYESCVD